MIPPRILPDHPAPVSESGDRRCSGVEPLEPGSHNRETTLARKNGTGGSFDPRIEMLRFPG
jgi:hypothetical protein